MKYTLNATLLILLLLFSNLAFSQCTGVVPPFSLGNDTTICEGTSLTLSPGANFDYYLWDNGSNLPVRNVSQAGTYNVQVGVIGQNIIVNGDFESGNTGFNTDYVYGTGGSWGLLSTEGQYAISTSPSLTHTNFIPCADHTSGAGNMLIANGAGTPNTNVWCQDVTVTPNTDYLFSAWISNVLNGVNVANLQFYVDGIAIGNIFSTNTTGCIWENYNDIWNSGAATSVTICIVNQNTTNAGNDFAIDDISFAPICIESDTIIVSTNPAPIITTDPAVTICEGETATINAFSSSNNLTYTWNPGNLQGSVISVTPSSSTTYSVTAESSLGCTSNLAFVPVVVSPLPTLDITSSDDTLCLGEQAQLTANASSNVTYEWNPQNSTSQTILVSPESTTNYSVTITDNNGCQNSASIDISVIPSYTLEIIGETSFCDNESTVLSATGSQSGMDFLWLPSNTTMNSITIDDNNSGWIYLEGSLNDCPSVIDSVFTQSIQTPVVLPIDDIQTCPNQSVQVNANSNIPTSTFLWIPENLIGSSQSLNTPETQTYQVYAQNGECVSEPVTFIIETSLTCDLEVPNVFSPNEDFLNDGFMLISSEGIESIEVTIVNRWSNPIISFNDPKFIWDGKDRFGNEVHEGTYFYAIKAITSSGASLEKQGFVELVR